MNRHLAFAGTALTSMSVLMLELVLTRLFSATMYYHFAFMAISVALLGSGASGVVIFLLLSKISEARRHEWLGSCAALFAISVIFAVIIILQNPLDAAAPAGTYTKLAIIYSATALAFFFGGCVITLAIHFMADDIGRLYFFDLAGAALGCLLLIPFLNHLGAFNTVLVTAALASLAAAVFISVPGSVPAARFAIWSLFIGLGTLALFNIGTGRFGIEQLKGLQTRDLLFSRWNSFSHISVAGKLTDPALIIRIDADAETRITKGGGSIGKLTNPPVTIEGLVHFLKPEGKVLIIGPGGGNDVVLARAFGHESIVGVEVNPMIAEEVMKSEPFLSYSGRTYLQPGVQVVVDEGRSFIRGSSIRYEVIQANMVDTWAATAAGAFALAENNLYTVEAFQDYIDHLTDDGFLSMTRWYFEPPDQLWRLISLTRAAMSRMGITNPGRHMMVFKYGGTDFQAVPATFIFKRSELTDAEVRRIEEIARRQDFDILYTPLTHPPGLFTELIESADPQAIWSQLPINIEPTTDNDPFFFNTLRISSLATTPRGVEEWRKTNLATYVLFALLTIALLLVALFIIGPLLLAKGGTLRQAAGKNGSILMYFAFIGVAFIIVEVVLIQKFILFLGHPVYALAVVLFSLLSFSGIGSFLSGRIADKDLPKLASVIIALIVITVGVYLVMLSPMFYALVYLPRMVRIVISVALIAPIALLMGMPMPLGIRITRQRAPEVTPWGWGVNGAASVLGSIGALAIAITTGFNQALAVGAVFYLLSLLFLRRLAPEGRSQS